MKQQELVKALLEHGAIFRNSDKETILYIQQLEAEQNGITTIQELFDGMRDGRISYGCSIRAAICSIKKKYPHLKADKEVQEKKDEVKEQYKKSHRDLEV